MTGTKRLYSLLTLSFLGFCISIYQTFSFFELRNGLAGFKSFCTFGDSFNCQAVELSTWAELLPGIPLSTFAASWYLAFFIILFLGKNPYRRKQSLKAGLIFTIISTAFSLFYLMIMISVVRSGCILCLVIDGINLASLAIILSLKPFQEKTTSTETSPWKTFIGVLVGSFLFCLFLNAQLNTSRISGEEKEAVLASILMQSPVDVKTPSDLPYKGLPPDSKDVKITIVKFSDFQCPACKRGAFAIHPLLSRYADKIRFVYRAFPLSPKCNRLIDRDIHPAACEAARVALCAQKEGKFSEVYEALFENQNSLASKGALKIVSELNSKLDLNTEELQACVDSQEIKQKVMDDIEEGFRLSVRSTPTFFINGRKVEGSLTTEAWVEIIERLLEKK